jgi:hypothetical protein
MAKGSSRRAVVEVQGARELRRQLKKAEGDLNEMKDIHREIGHIIFHAARPKTPRGTRKAPPGRTRRLYETLRYFPTRTSVRVMAGSKVVPYANAIHWGRKIFPSKRSDYAHKHSAPFAARPWISEAAQASEPEWTAYYRSEVQKILDKIEGLGKEPTNE